MPERVSDVRIRMAADADAGEIIAVTNTAFAVESFISGTRTDPESLAGMMRKGVFLIAERSAAERSHGLLASVYIELRGARGYFGMLAVDPAFQGIGLGRRMVEAAEDYCRRQGCRYLDLTTLSLRPELPPFYRKLGYLETGTEPFRPARPLVGGVKCHCIVMSKTL